MIQVPDIALDHAREPFCIVSRTAIISDAQIYLPTVGVYASMRRNEVALVPIIFLGLVWDICYCVSNLVEDSAR